MKKVLEYIKKYHMIQPGDCVIAGVSGGADSLCLLFVLADLRRSLDFRLEAVHVEHGIRGEESLGDAAYVEEICKNADIPFHLYSCKVPQRARRERISVEEAARKCRYEAFEEACRTCAGTKIAVAHNADDQAETILFNLVRGSGMRGLCGMRPVNGNVIRPLLDVTRGEIEAWLTERQLRWRTDSTNLELAYTRNRLRRQVIPLLQQELNEQASRHIVQAGERLSRAEAFLEKLGAEKAQEMCAFKEGQFWLDREKLLAQEEIIQEYILRGLLDRLGTGLRDIRAEHYSQMQKLARGSSGRQVSLPQGNVCRCTGRFLVLGKRETLKKQPPWVELPVPGEAFWGPWRVTASVEPWENQIIPEKKYTKWLDYDTIKNTIQLRSRRPGDYFYTASGRKKLKRYFIDEKILQEERDRVLLVADGEHVLWIVGHRISQQCKVTEDTRRILKIQVVEA